MKLKYKLVLAIMMLRSLTVLGDETAAPNVPNENAEKETKASVSLLSGYTGYPGIHDGGFSTGFELLLKNAALNSNEMGDWEGGGSETIVFGQRHMANMLVYVGHRLDDDSRLHAGITAGIGILNNPGIGGFYTGNDKIGALAGPRLSYDLPVTRDLVLSPIANGNFSSLTSVSFIYSFTLSVSYSFPYHFPH
jgi:hypothetical protein